jgi:hypothetical protein
LNDITPGGVARLASTPQRAYAGRAEEDAMGSEERIVDYLVCRQCNSPCYVFEMEGEQVIEAFCEVCGNDAPRRFLLGDYEDDWAPEPEEEPGA